MQSQDQSYQWDYTKCRIKTVKPLRSSVKSHPWKLEAGQLSYFGYKAPDEEIWFGFVNGVHFALSSILEVPVHPNLKLIRPGEGVLADLPYAVPFQTPLYWKDEQSGMLIKAIEAFISCMRTEGSAFMYPEEFGLVKEYLIYYINAPCWKSGFLETAGVIEELGEKIKTVDNIGKLDNWIKRCLELGLDPL